MSSGTECSEGYVKCEQWKQSVVRGYIKCE